MDKKTERFLASLNQQAAKMFKTKFVEDTASKELKARAEWAYKKTGDRRIKEQLDRGAFEPRDKRMVDNASTKKIDEFLNFKIKRAIEHGEIKPAEKDEFIRRIQK